MWFKATLTVLQEWCAKWKLYFNLSWKSGVMHVDKNNPRCMCKIQMGDVMDIRE